MFVVFWRRNSHLVCIAIALLGFLSGCGPARYAYFQPQQNDFQRLQSTSSLPVLADTVPAPSAVLPENSASFVTAPLPITTVAPKSDPPSVPTTVNSVIHRNPDSYHNQRFNKWFRSLPVAHVAPKTQLIDRHSRSRKTYKLALVALGMGVLSFSSLFIIGGSTLTWVLGVTLPLATTLLGVASMTTIKRNQDRYRGKGWAMAAIMLGTGVLGLALVALAALSVSETINR